VLSPTSQAASDFVNQEAFSLLGGPPSKALLSPRKRVFFHSKSNGGGEGGGVQENGDGSKRKPSPDQSWRSDYVGRPGTELSSPVVRRANESDGAAQTLASPLQQVTREFFAVLDDADERQARQEAVRMVVAQAEKERAHRVAELRVRALNIMKGIEFSISCMSQTLPFTLGIDDEFKATIVSVASHKQGFGGNAMRANHISEGDHLVAINDQPVEGWSLSAIRARLGIAYSRKFANIH
jgi:hypothetical protein